MSVFKLGDKVVFGGEVCKVCGYANGYRPNEKKMVTVEGEFLVNSVSEDYLLEMNPQYKDRLSEE